MRFEVVHFPLVSGPHGTTGTVQHGNGILCSMSRDGVFTLDVFTHSCMENALQCACFTVAARALVKILQIAARPESVFEIDGFGPGAFDSKHFLENKRPAHKGNDYEQSHDELNQQRSIGDQRNKRKILGNSHFIKSKNIENPHVPAICIFRYSDPLIAGESFTHLFGDLIWYRSRPDSFSIHTNDCHTAFVQFIPIP